MKAVVILAMLGFSSLALAEQVNAADQAPSAAVEQYTYDMKLDVAHVISTTDVSNECGIVPARMTYEDTQGQRHTVEYQVWGNGQPSFTAAGPPSQCCDCARRSAGSIAESAHPTPHRAGTAPVSSPR